MSGNKAQNPLWECKTANSVVRLMTDAWSSTENYHMYKDAEKYKIRSKIIPLKMTHNWPRQLGYWTGLTVTTAKMCCSHAETWFIESQRLGMRGRVVEKTRQTSFLSDKGFFIVLSVAGFILFFSCSVSLLSPSWALPSHYFLKEVIPSTYFIVSLTAYIPSRIFLNEWLQWTWVKGSVSPLPLHNSTTYVLQVKTNYSQGHTYIQATCYRLTK